jgi:hypothetical protein
VQLSEPPDSGKAGDLRLRIRGRVAGQLRWLVRLGLGHPRIEALVHEQSPHLLVGHLAHELLDVDAAVAERAAFLVGLGDLGLDGDDAFESRLEVRDLAHPAGRYQARGK